MYSALKTSVAKPSLSFAANAAAYPNESTLCATSTTPGLRASINAADRGLEGVRVEFRRRHLDGDDLVDAGEF